MAQVRDEVSLAEGVSIGDLVRMRAGLTEDAWKLALVQRDEAWNEYRVARLLDSILAGYPIGNLLLCRTRQRSAVLELGRTTLRAVHADSSWQILDGQQRILAISSLFLEDDSGEDDHPSRFYLNLSSERAALDPGKDKRIRQFVVWETLEEHPFEDRGPRRSRQRGEWLDLSLLGKWLLKNDPLPVAELTDSELMDWLGKVDEACTTVWDGAAGRARERLARLVERWSTRWLPVQKLELDGPDDVLQVFTRVNLEGVRTSAADIFFAAVKTEWTQAEEVLEAVRKRAPFLGRLDALRLVARLASYELRQIDIVPLQIQRLRGEDGKRIVQKMEQIARNPAHLDSLEKVATYLIQNSGLGYALRLVDGPLVDQGLGWALTHPEASSRDFDRIAGYLFWGTAYRLAPVLRYEMSRVGMKLCVLESGETFPLDAIAKVVKETWPSLAYSRSRVAQPFHASGDLDWTDASDTVNERARLFLAVAQKLPFDPSADGTVHRLDWDHVYPRAKRNRIKWRGEDGTWKLQLYRPGTKLINRAGNLAALEARTNRHLQDLGPKEKLERIEAMERKGTLWPPSLLLDDADRNLLRRFDELVDAEKVVEGVEEFQAFVSRRERRLWEIAVEAFPEVKVFRRLLVAE